MNWDHQCDALLDTEDPFAMPLAGQRAAKLSLNAAAFAYHYQNC